MVKLFAVVHLNKPSGRPIYLLVVLLGIGKALAGFTHLSVVDRWLATPK